MSDLLGLLLVSAVADEAIDALLKEQIAALLAAVVVHVRRRWAAIR